MGCFEGWVGEGVLCRKGMCGGLFRWCVLVVSVKVSWGGACRVICAYGLEGLVVKEGISILVEKSSFWICDFAYCLIPLRL